MRRLGMTVALGAVLGLFGGMVTAAPALASRGSKWEFLAFKPFTLPAALCGFKIRVTLPAAKEYEKTLKASDGSMTTLVTGTLKLTFTAIRCSRLDGGPPAGRLAVEADLHGELAERLAE